VLAARADEVEHVGDHDGVLEGVGGRLEPGEQIARHHTGVGGVVGQQTGRRRPVAALGDRDNQRGLETHQGGEELTTAGREPAGGHHRLIDPHPGRTDRGDLLSGGEHRTHHRVPPDPELPTDPIDRDVVRRRRDRCPCGGLGPHRSWCDRRGPFHEGPAPLDAGQQPLAPDQPAGPAGDRQVAHVVVTPVVQRMEVDDPAVDARLDVAGQLDVGDELVVLIDVGVGQDELGQGKQQLAPPLNRGSVVHAYGLGRSVGRHLEHRGHTCSHQASPSGSPTTEGKTRLTDKDEAEKSCWRAGGSLPDRSRHRCRCPCLLRA
jgi:hypothetical protein